MNSLRFFALGLLLLVPAPLWAQNPAPKNGGFTYSAAKLTYNKTGVRLDGSATNPARINSPELSVVATSISFDLSASAISEVRANGNVALKVNLKPSGGGEVTHIETKSATATLQTRAKRLTLIGNVSGFYRIGLAPKNTFSGERATLGLNGKNIVADVVGEQKGVIIEIAAQTLGGAADLGTLKISAARANINQESGEATFSGNARAVSVGGATAFDLSATQFVLTRGADGLPGTLRTLGKTSVKYDLPPDSTPAGGKIGAPTHVEVSSDGAVFERANASATFSGAVKGFYRLAPANGAPQNYNFAGERAIIRFDAAGNALGGLNVEVTALPDQQVTIEAPAFDTGL